jgi:hypothetical protein
MQIPKILNVVASDHKLLTIVFTNGEKKIYDVSRLWDNEMFAPLKNPSFFKNVKVETGGYAVYWNDKIDISEYEWKADPENNNRKTRYYFQLPSKAPFAFAGLWDTWQKDYHGCTIITRDAVGEVREVHDRMPCVLKPEAYAVWLDADNQDVGGLMDVLQSAVCPNHRQNNQS